MYLIFFLNLNYSIYKKIKRIFHLQNLLLLRIKNVEELIIFYFDNHEWIYFSFLKFVLSLVINFIFINFINFMYQWNVNKRE